MGIESVLIACLPSAITGFCFVDSLVLGMKSLMFSAEFFMDDEEEEKEREKEEKQRREAQDKREKLHEQQELF